MQAACLATEEGTPVFASSYFRKQLEFSTRQPNLVYRGACTRMTLSNWGRSMLLQPPSDVHSAGNPPAHIGQHPFYRAHLLQL